MTTSTILSEIDVILCICSPLVTTFIFFSAWDKSHVKLDNSRNATQKILFLIRNNDNKQTRFFKLVDCYSVWIWLFAEDIAIIEGLGTNPELSKKNQYDCFYEKQWQ